MGSLKKFSQFGPAVWPAITYIITREVLLSNQMNILVHSRKSFLFSNQDHWLQKIDSYFDVTMGHGLFRWR